ncbi:type VII secretion protein EccB [Streptomyces meridianus]|uniref:Type VII secretion protein EccB n=1 Tax=Streptomyces meridianus TaxID=2938945 RepID=A0ABT0XBD6_9ACTN|nr:type VII secretion protein EccB [Streptomyces meridianus]MCM2579835.1 type VII secretion protein EccB [Streptomyces meridianus]
MASRRDELNAYSFARKRTVASFLKPLPNGSMESAPRPVRTVLPSVVLGMVILAGFGACGLIKPAAPKDWDKAYAHVIVGDESTTRYVVLNTGEKDRQGRAKTQLHPVMNLASARLLLKENADVLKVKESVLDGRGAPPHGPMIGIPYAPDRLPSVDEARAKKTWALCERPGVGEGARSQRAVFVLSDKDGHRKKLTDTSKGKVDGHHSLFVQTPDEKKYLVDQQGVAHRLDATWYARKLGQSVGNAEQFDQTMEGILFKQAQPQQVSQEWLDSLIQAPVPIFFPLVKNPGGRSSTTGVDEQHRTVGKVLEADGDHFVVLDDGVAPVSDFVAKLLLEGPIGRTAYPGEDPEAIRVGRASVTPDKPQFLEELGGHKLVWPKEATSAANSPEAGGDSVVCSVYYGGEKTIGGVSTGFPEMTTWAGKDYPAPIAEGSSSYVSSGSGLLYKETMGKSTDGSLFLVTDTGLRYSIPVNNDSSTTTGNDAKDKNQSQIRLGYGAIASPPLVPKEWSRLLSAGPSLNVTEAKRPQSS